MPGRIACRSRARRCSSPGPRAASGLRSRCMPRATAPTSRSPPRPRRRIPSCPGTIHSAAEEIEKAGGKALPLVVDVREEENVKQALDKTAQHFGGIDIVVNNASAIQLTNVQQTDMKRFDLMHQINTRGTFMVSQARDPASAEGREPAYPDALAAARHEGEMVRGAHRLHHGEVRHEPRGAGPRRRTARQGRGECAVAAHRDRDLGGEEPARRRRADAHVAHARTFSRTPPTRSSTSRRASPEIS